jgi:mono/diheme cytochrome c family protein
MGNSQCTWLRLGLLAILLLVGGCAATQGGPVTQGDATLGRSLWAQSDCVGCHGVDAEGSPAGPALTNTPLGLGDVTHIVRRGGPGMPAYPESQISDQDLQDMYAWFLNPVPAPTSEREQDPWTQSACVGCHGVNAQGGTGPALGGTKQPFAAFQTVVRQGAHGMPAYPATRISDQTLQEMYAWLQAQAPAPAPTGEREQDPWTQSDCAACHGVNALGGMGPSLADTSQPFAAFQTVVRQGAHGMPAFPATRISDQTLQAIYDWLQAQAPAPDAQQTLWVQMGCGACHGTNAEGASAPALTGEESSYDEFQRVVRRGEEGMPAYSTSQISDTDLRRMYDWLLTLP